MSIMHSALDYKPVIYFEEFILDIYFEEFSMDIVVSQQTALTEKMHCREQFSRTASEYSAIVL